MFPTFSDSAVFGSQLKGTKLYIFTIQTTNSQFRSFHACVVILASPHQQQCACSFLKRSLAQDCVFCIRCFLSSTLAAAKQVWFYLGLISDFKWKQNVEFPAVQGTCVRQRGPCLVWLADHRHGRLNLLRASLRRCKFKLLLANRGL